MIPRYLRHRFGYKKAKQILKNSSISAELWKSPKVSKLNGVEKLNYISKEIADVSLLNKFMVLDSSIQQVKNKIASLKEEQIRLRQVQDTKNKFRDLLKQKTSELAEMLGDKFFSKLDKHGFKSNEKAPFYFYAI